MPTPTDYLSNRWYLVRTQPPTVVAYYNGIVVFKDNLEPIGSHGTNWDSLAQDLLNQIKSITQDGTQPHIVEV